MRELWTTGYMHNRVRMIVASFFTGTCSSTGTKGEQWFWDTLVLRRGRGQQRQWLAMDSGNERGRSAILPRFNPVLQGEKFDPKGEYASKWVPSLASFPQSGSMPLGCANFGVGRSGRHYGRDLSNFRSSTMTLRTKRALTHHKSSARETSA